jgi:hypothetical protein
MKGSTYGIAALARALRFVQTRRYALDVGCGCEGRIYKDSLGARVPLFYELSSTGEIPLVLVHCDLVESGFGPQFRVFAYDAAMTAKVSIGPDRAASKKRCRSRGGGCKARLRVTPRSGCYVLRQWTYPACHLSGRLRRSDYSFHT